MVRGFDDVARPLSLSKLEVGEFANEVKIW